MNHEGDGDVSEVRCGEQVLNQSWKHLVHVGSSRGGDEKQQVCVSASYYTAHRILGKWWSCSSRLYQMVDSGH